METVETQVARCMKMIRSRQTNIDRYLYLSSVKDQNMDLFYRLLIDNARELMPLVYTPTIGDVCLQYSTIYTRPEALYISIKQRKSMRTILQNWPYPNRESMPHTKQATGPAEISGIPKPGQVEVQNVRRTDGRDASVSAMPCAQLPADPPWVAGRAGEEYSASL